MDKEQIERFKSLMEEGKAESERPLLKEKTEKLESLMEDEDIEKFKRHEIECRKYLMSKYFSDNTIFGGNTFDVKTTKDGETTKMSSLPGYQSYANPASFPGSQSYANPPSFSGSQSYAYPAIFNVAINKKPNSTSETPSDVRKGKQPSKKN